MIKKIIIILIGALLCGSAMAGEFSKSGTAGAQFLKVGVGARYQGLGEASVAAVNDIYSMYWNPAGLTGIDQSQLALTYVNYLTDINLNYVAYARRFENLGIFGASVTVLSMGDQEITTVEEPEGTGFKYSASSYAFQLSFARELTTQFSFGASLKYLGEKIYRERAAGFAFDFGTLLRTGYRSLRIGMNISNMGPEMKFDGPDLDVSYDPDQSNPNHDPFNSRLKVDPYDLPLTFRVGMAYDLNFGADAKLMLAVEAKHPNDNTQQGSLGAEFNWKDKYFLRGGYKFNYAEEGLGLGAGFRTQLTEGTDLVFDYAWVDFGRLDAVHRFSAALAF
ncbi:MAG: PorV/PorQ family protein [candidate division Zixibacteria bacterium]|jgi:long-subunit fatty acid transport protein|nr:PorV/PorQ family protein [candidate division Zixibacteria bacterium]